MSRFKKYFKKTQIDMRNNTIQLGSPEYLQTHTTKRILNEEWAFNTTMSRMMSYVNENGLCLLSAFRNDKDKNQNMKRHVMMKEQFRRKNVKVVEVDGVFIENKGQASEKHVEELFLAAPFFPENWSDEYSEEDKNIAGRLISNISFASTKDMTPFDKFVNFCMKIGGIFNQDAVIIAKPGDGVYLQYRTGNIEKIGTHATPDKIGEAYTRLRYGIDSGRTFIFEGTRSPHNHIDAYRLQAEGILF